MSATGRKNGLGFPWTHESTTRPGRCLDKKRSTISSYCSGGAQDREGLYRDPRVHSARARSTPVNIVVTELDLGRLPVVAGLCLDDSVAHRRQCHVPCRIAEVDERREHPVSALPFGIDRHSRVPFGALRDAAADPSLVLNRGPPPARDASTPTRDPHRGRGPSSSSGSTAHPIAEGDRRRPSSCRALRCAHTAGSRCLTTRHHRVRGACPAASVGQTEMQRHPVIANVAFDSHRA
jgi:hypothetical protein